MLRTGIGIVAMFLGLVAFSTAGCAPSSKAEEVKNTTPPAVVVPAPAPDTTVVVERSREPQPAASKSVDGGLDQLIAVHPGQFYDDAVVVKVPSGFAYHSFTADGSVGVTCNTNRDGVVEAIILSSRQGRDEAFVLLHFVPAQSKK
jgi:hypothetical protein